MAIGGDLSTDVAFGLRIKLWVENNMKFKRHEY